MSTGKENRERMGRRAFVRLGTGGLVAGAAGLRWLGGRARADDGAPAAARPLVVRTYSEKALKGGMPQRETVDAMLERAARELSGRAFPDLLRELVGPDDVVGLKVNPLSGFELCTNIEVVQSVAAALVAGGIPENRVLVWDRFEDHLVRCMYDINRGPTGIRCYGAEHKSDLGLDTDVGYDSPLGDGKPSYFYKIVTREVTRIINLPVPKDHNCAGITGCLKNLAFGSVNNTARFHPGPHFCDPMIGEICAHPAVRGKVVLHVMDALKGVYDGGPAANPNATFELRELWMGRDPVAMDSVLLGVIDAERQKGRKAPIGQGGATARHIETAAKLGLGVASPDAARVVRVEMS